MPSLFVRLKLVVFRKPLRRFVEQSNFLTIFEKEERKTVSFSCYSAFKLLFKGKFGLNLLSL